MLTVSKLSIGCGRRDSKKSWGLSLAAEGGGSTTGSEERVAVEAELGCYPGSTVWLYKKVRLDREGFLGINRQGFLRGSRDAVFGMGTAKTQKIGKKAFFLRKKMEVVVALEQSFTPAVSQPSKKEVGRTFFDGFRFSEVDVWGEFLGRFKVIFFLFWLCYGFGGLTTRCDSERLRKPGEMLCVGVIGDTVTRNLGS